MKALIFITLIAISAPVTAHANDSTQALLSACRPVTEADTTDDYVKLPQTFKAGYCWGAFSSIQKVIVSAGRDGQHFFGVCAPSDSTRLQHISVFSNYAKRNPQKLHEDFFVVAISSLREAFPCK